MANGQSPEVRFWSKVERLESGCWIWIGLKRFGYGMFYGRQPVSGRRQYVRAHRTAYEWSRGPIPDGLELDHLCRVKACVNPDHLEPVTSRENTLRGIGPSAKNALKTHCYRGHEFLPENTYHYTNGDRGCRICAIEKARARWASGEIHAQRLRRKARDLVEGTR